MTPNETHVDLISSGYEWICPDCELHNKEIEITEKVKCSYCWHEFITNPAEHAQG